MSQTLTCLLVHVIFSTKNRSPILTPTDEPELFAYIGGIGRNHQSSILAANGTPDHVHLLVSLSKNIALSDLLMEIKRDSSRWMHERSTTNRDFAWQDGYAAFSLGASQLNAAKRYIARQKEHHGRTSFQDELRQFLQKYEVQYDEQYLWQ